MSEVKSDIEIAQSSEMLPIFEVAKRAGIPEDLLSLMVAIRQSLMHVLCDKPLRESLCLLPLLTQRQQVRERLLPQLVWQML